jgi:hypothetical protein
MGRDVGGSIPRGDSSEVDQFRGCILLVLELVDADRCEYRHDGSVGTGLCHLFCGASERPSAPVKADDRRRGGAEGHPLQPAEQRGGLQD